MATEAAERRLESGVVNIRISRLSPLIYVEDKKFPARVRETGVECAMEVVAIGTSPCSASLFNFLELFHLWQFVTGFLTI